MLMLIMLTEEWQYSFHWSTCMIAWTVEGQSCMTSDTDRKRIQRELLQINKHMDTRRIFLVDWRGDYQMLGTA